jgi:hypothetical protein
VFKLRGKKSGIYIKDKLGTRKYDHQDELLKMTSLGREIMLRITMRMLKDKYDDLKSKGMLRWVAYKEERANINGLIDSINRSLAIYKHRRLQVGLFYLVPCANVYNIEIKSHILRMPLKEALKRRRLDMKKRRKILANSNYNAPDTTVNEHVTIVRQSVFGSECTKRLLLYTVASIVLGCIIVFF